MAAEGLSSLCLSIDEQVLNYIACIYIYLIYCHTTNAVINHIHITLQRGMRGERAAARRF